jgi:DNA-binding GntR family transcriptional regulator
MILDGGLAQGTVVNEAELVRQLGMSRTPVREALNRLEVATYLRSVPGVGYVVIELSERDLVNAYMARAVLEGLAAENAAQLATRTDIARLEDLFDAMIDANKGHDDKLLASLNSQFHNTIAEAGRNTYVQAMLENIRDVFERFRATALAQPRRRDASHQEHEELKNAIRDGNSRLAGRLAIEHVHRALEVRRADWNRGTSEAAKEPRPAPKKVRRARA